MPANTSKSPYASKRPTTRFPPLFWRSLLLGGVLLVILGWLLLGQQLLIPGATDTLAPIATVQAADYHSLAVSPQDANRIWFGTHEGIQESTDGGRTWQARAGVHGDAMSLVWPPGDPTWIYMAGHDVLQRSTDGGQNWQAVTTDLPGTDLHDFAADPVYARHVYTVVAGQGLFASLDGGDHWNFVPTQPPGEIGGLAVTSGKPTRVYAVSDSGVVYSRDGGSTWQAANNGLPAAEIYTLLAVPGRPQQLYAGTANGLYQSTDGASWQAVGLAGQRVLALTVSAAGSLRVYALTDAGRIFRLEGAALGHAAARPLPERASFSLAAGTPLARP